uniref:Uncharacterized protein n=1 Tax=Hippocampus comes TaxID=109280 RepID=A0A3Q3DFN6_HIPCM
MRRFICVFLDRNGDSPALSPTWLLTERKRGGVHEGARSGFPSPQSPRTMQILSPGMLFVLFLLRAHVCLSTRNIGTRLKCTQAHL